MTETCTMTSASAAIASISGSVSMLDTVRGTWDEIKFRTVASYKM
jgi:hypothetical protein